MSNEYEKIRNKALSLLSYRARSRKELEDKLKKKKYDSELINKCLDNLEKTGLINDNAFAKGWIKNRLSSKPKGKRILQRELEQKGINGNIIKDVMNETYETVDEVGLVKDLAERKWKSLSRLDFQKANQRLFSYLARRGFGYDIISKVMKEYKTKTGRSTYEN